MTETHNGFVSTKVAGALVLVALGLGVIAGYLVRKYSHNGSDKGLVSGRPPKDTPIEVAGNGIHTCNPFGTMSGGGNKYQAYVNNDTEAYIAQAYGVDGIAVDLKQNHWKTIQVILNQKDQPQFTLTAGEPHSAGNVPVTIDLPQGTPSTPATNGQGFSSACPSGGTQCLDSFVFYGADGVAIATAPCNQGACQLFLGSPKQKMSPYQCWNQ